MDGATSASYTTPATTANDNAAQFTVTVTNSAGSATSNAATLTVTSSTAMNYLVAYNSNPSAGSTGLVNNFIRIG